jgi:homoserine kinase
VTPHDLVVRTPASSANLGAGFDVFGMALNLYADVGLGPAPKGAHQVDDHHPAREAFDLLGGRGPIWLRCNIPMARGLGFSGAVRVGAAGLAAAQRADEPATAIDEAADEILGVATRLEGHGDNVAASLFGGVTAFVEERAHRFVVGPRLGGAAFVAWIPDVTTSTNSSRRTLAPMVDRSAAVHNIGRAVQFALAFAHDEPSLLAGATHDRMHQSARLPLVPGAAAAIDAGVEAGAWCAWLSGSGPTVGMLVDPSLAAPVAASLPDGGHTNVLAIDVEGARLTDSTSTS